MMRNEKEKEKTETKEFTTNVSNINALTDLTRKSEAVAEYRIVKKRTYIIEDKFEHQIVPRNNSEKLEEPERKGEDFLHLESKNEVRRTTT